MIVVLVVAAGAAWESAALELIGARAGMVVLKRCVDVDELLATSSAGQADAAVVALDAPGLDVAAVEALHRHQLRVVAVADGSDAASRRGARVGVDVVLGHDELDRLPDALEGHHDRSAYSPDPAEDGVLAPDGARHGRIVTVWGPAGAPGRTTVAVSLAAALARRGTPTTLVDADPYGGSVAAHLGILDETSGLLGAARPGADGGGAFGARVAAVQRAVGERLSVVTGLPRAERWVEVRAGVIEHLLEVARLQGNVVVDTGFSLEDDPTADLRSRPPRNQLTLGAIDVADQVLVVGTPDPVGLARLARGLADLRDRGVGVPVRVAVNRMRSSVGWSEREVTGMVEEFARPTGVHFLPDDRAAADRALAAGVAIVQTGESELARALAALADLVEPPAAGARGSRRRGARRRVTGLRTRTAGTTLRR